MLKHVAYLSYVYKKLFPYRFDDGAFSFTIHLYANTFYTLQNTFKGGDPTKVFCKLKQKHVNVKLIY